jgi:hypothetical protein
MTVYKCFKSDFEDLQKRINRITKKLTAYGKKWTFEQLSETVEEVTIWDYINHDNVPMWQFKPKNKGKIVVDVISYTFEMESLKLGNYEVIAVLEHNAIQDSNENLIHVIKEGVTIPLQYRTVKSICEHCNNNRQRNKTVLLQDNTGNIKQVGTTCIKEYTGIDGIDIINNYIDIHDIILEELQADYEKIGSYPRYEKTIDYLASCIQLITESGYNKETTKYKAWEIAGTDRQDKKYFDTATKVIEYFKNSTFTESQDFLNNIKLYLSQEYTKMSGFVAYAYIAYQKQIEYEQKKQAENENKKPSEFIGKIGDKIEIELTLKKRIAYETNYTYYGGTSYIYIFEDNKGNTYKWNSSNFLEKIVNSECIAINENDSLKLKGSIKAHEEYKEQKQTVLTRCKIVE